MIKKHIKNKINFKKKNYFFYKIRFLLKKQTCFKGKFDNPAKTLFVQ